jgi:hypothetical protein
MFLPVGIIRAAAGTGAVLALLGAAAVGRAAVPGAISSQVLCTTAFSRAANVNTDCQNAGNYGETGISVNPNWHSDIVGGVIDTTISTVNGHTRFSQFVEPHVSVDGGRAWANVGLDFGNYASAVDPSVAFDASGRVYLATANSGEHNDVTVATSEDGGLGWTAPVSITKGIDGKSFFNDHPQLTAFGDGNILVTWIHDVFDASGHLLAAPVYDAVSHDGGKSWSAPSDISGSAPFCVGIGGGDACDQTFGNSVAVSGGRAVVAFQQTYHEAPDAGASLGRDTYMTVVVDPATGQTVSGPTVVGEESDGIIEHDYPLNRGGVQTLHDSQFALDSDGNVAADPTAPGMHFALVFYDDRGAALPMPADPYQAMTKAGIVVSQTFDGGNTWSPPTVIPDAHDQFMPWAAYDATGALRVGFLDRSYDPADDKYGYTLATETQPGSLQFTLQELSTALSDPTRNDLPSRGTVNPLFPYPAAFIGDYTALAVDGEGVVAYWTDFRDQACQGGRCGYRSDSYFARGETDGG